MRLYSGMSHTVWPTLDGLRIFISVIISLINQSSNQDNLKSSEPKNPRKITKWVFFDKMNWFWPKLFIFDTAHLFN